MQREKRRAYRQAVKQQVKGRRLVFAGRQVRRQIEKIKTPMAAGGIGMPPAEDQATGAEKPPAKCLLLTKAGERLNLGSR